MGNKRSNGGHKVNVDADLIVKAMEEYYTNSKFGLILISGDGDFVPLIRFFEKEKQFVKIITADKNSTSNMLSYDRHTKCRRNLTYFNPGLRKLTKKYLPFQGEWRELMAVNQLCPFLSQVFYYK